MQRIDPWTYVAKPSSFEANEDSDSGEPAESLAEASCNQDFELC